MSISPHRGQPASCIFVPSVQMAGQVPTPTGTFARASILPYKKGWVYIFNLEIKVGKNAKIIMGDNHYCCPEHMLEHMLEHIKNAVENRIASIKR